MEIIQKRQAHIFAEYFIRSKQTNAHKGTGHYLWPGGCRKNMRGAISIIGFTKGGLDEIHNQPRGASHYYLKIKYGIFR